MLISFAQAKQNTQCERFYINKPTALELIMTNLGQNPNGYPMLIVSDSLNEHFLEIKKRYKRVIDIISTQGSNNAMVFSVQTTTAALETFQNLNKKLLNELEKSKLNRLEIDNLGKDMKTCLIKLDQCNVNLRLALKHVEDHITLGKNLLEDLSKKTIELSDIIPQLRYYHLFDDTVLKDIELLVEQQKQLIANSFSKIVSDSIVAQQSLRETATRYASLQIPWAKNQAALLESKEGAPIMGALSLEESKENSYANDFANSGDHSFAIEKRNSPLNDEETNLSKGAARFHEKIKSSELSSLGETLLKKLIRKEIDYTNFLR